MENLFDIGTLRSRAALAVALSVLLFGTLAMPSPAEALSDVTKAARSLTRISGPSGGQTFLRIDRTVHLNNAGADSVVDSSGGWAGVLIQRIEDDFEHFSKDWYVSYRFTRQSLCPGAKCPMPLATHMADSGVHTERADGSYTLDLRPGTYAVVLLGDPGKKVTAELHLNGLEPGSLDLSTTSKADLRSDYGEVIGADGHDLASREYMQDDVPGPRFDGLAMAFVLSTPATASGGWCFTDADEPGLHPTSAICAGGGGGPHLPTALVDVGNTAYGFNYALAVTPEGYFSHGYDAEAVANESRLITLWFKVVF